MKELKNKSFEVIGIDCDDIFKILHNELRRLADGLIKIVL